MVDADSKPSTQLSLAVTQQKNSKLTVKLSADKNFLKECTYPVTIDPVFNVTRDWGTAECAYVDSANPNTSYGYGSSTGYAYQTYVGTFGQGMYRTYYKPKELPTLNKGDMVVSAYINFGLIADDFYSDMNVSAYYVNSSWSQSSISWNNQPSFSSTIIDYEVFNKNTKIGFYNWDITSCVKRWYNGEVNNGIMLKLNLYSATKHN